jgi:hypothetical protein
MKEKEHELGDNVMDMEYQGKGIMVGFSFADL